MFYRLSIIFLWLFCQFACTSNSTHNEAFPVIHLETGEAQVLKMSELFDGYEVFTFKGIICNKIGDFVKIKDQILATSVVMEGSKPIVSLCVFDSVGEFQHTLGAFGRGPGEYLYLSNHVLLTPDSNVMAMDVLGFHCYDMDGTLLWEKKFEQPSYQHLGYPMWMLNDDCVVYTVMPACGKIYRLGECFVNLWQWRNEQPGASYFPCQKVGNSIVRNYLYAIDSTVCYYSDIDYGIYNVSEDTTTLRYRIDKGQFDGFCTCDQRERLSDYLPIVNMSENNKYVLLEGMVARKYYFFVYDKFKKVTYTFDKVDDDLLSIGHRVYKSTSVLWMFSNWKPGMRQNDDYMYFYFSPSKFNTMLNRLKETLNEEQWQQYQQAHPDILKIYDELDDDSNTVVIGYRFK